MAKRYIPTIHTAGATVSQDEYFAYTVHENGKNLEDRVEKHLLSSYVPFKRNKTKGIDFIIDGDVHIDCVATSQSGSIDDKIPTKCFKYLDKYKLSELYILHPYSPIEPYVAKHLEFLETTMNVKIHILDWADFCYIVNGGKFETRKPYRTVKTGMGVKNHKVPTKKINQFFNFV